MTNITSQEIKDCLYTKLQNKDLQSKLSICESSLGWIEVHIVTNYFAGRSLSEREEEIDILLAPLELNLGQYPISSYSLLTPDEERNQPRESLQLPLWSDILMAPEQEASDTIDKDVPKRPHVVTFYSFKGGVGRSTALGMTATLLANRNRRVVMVDFDIEAPGISILFQSDVNQNGTGQDGVLDYIYQRSLTPDQNIPKIENCIYRVNLSNRGELFLIPVGVYNENYIHQLAELDRRTLQSFYKSEINPIKNLINDIKKSLDPDVILIDARPGFNDTGAIALLDLADTGIICFAPTDQSFEGLHWVVKAARKQFDYSGKPDLRFLLTPMPTLQEDLLNTSIARAEDWIEENWGVPNGMSVGELYNKVFYNPSIATLSSLVDVPSSLQNDYLPIVDVIDASLPDPKSGVPAVTHEERSKILDELHFEAARAQDLEAENIPEIFQRTEDFPNFITNKTWMIRGAKGTGKSLLFRLFVEQSEKAKELSISYVNLRNCHFVAGHGEVRIGKAILRSENLASYAEQIGNDKWAIFWLNYALLQLCCACPELRSIHHLDEQLVQLSTQDTPTQASVVSWLVERARSPQATPQASDELKSIDRWLSENKQGVWLLYDELDSGFGIEGEGYIRRKSAIEALLAWWLESGTNLDSIVPKIFIREDLWKQMNFTNKGHYAGKSLQLRWDESDLWRLVLRQALRSSSKLREELEREIGIRKDKLEKYGLEQLRKGLYPLWGERMGRNKKAYTYNWVRTRIADSNGNCFPRSLIVLLAEAVKNENTFSTEYSAEIVLRPKALIDSFPCVSQQRVEEVRNEYPELDESLQRLKGERSPIDENRLAEIWGLKDSKLSARIAEMVAAGILKERSRPKDSPPRIYAIAELYLYGLDMVRKGQR